MAEAYVGALCDLAPSKGCGFVDSWEKIRHTIKPGVEAAAYLSAYFVRKGGEGVPDGKTSRIQTFHARRHRAKPHGQDGPHERAACGLDGCGHLA